MSKPFTDYLDAFKTWMADTVKAINLVNLARTWTYIGSFYKDDLTKTAMVTFFDRGDLNSEYVREFENVNSANAYSHLEMQINAIYGFHKCFAQRHKSRLQYYEDDLSNKSCRLRATLNLAQGKMNDFVTTCTGGAKKNAN